MRGAWAGNVAPHQPRPADEPDLVPEARRALSRALDGSRPVPSDKSKACAERVLARWAALPGALQRQLSARPRWQQDVVLLLLETWLMDEISAPFEPWPAEDVPRRDGCARLKGWINDLSLTEYFLGREGRAYRARCARIVDPVVLGDYFVWYEEQALAWSDAYYDGICERFEVRRGGRNGAYVFLVCKRCSCVGYLSREHVVVRWCVQHVCADLEQASRARAHLLSCIGVRKNIPTHVMWRAHLFCGYPW